MRKVMMAGVAALVLGAAPALALAQTDQFQPDPAQSAASHAKADAKAAKQARSRAQHASSRARHHAKKAISDSAKSQEHAVDHPDGQ